MSFRLVSRQADLSLLAWELPSIERQDHNSPRNNGHNGQTGVIPGLLRDILADLRALFEQQLTLFREEIKRDFSRARTGFVLVAGGIGVLLPGVCFLLLMLVHLLHSAAELPLWASYGIVGAGLVVLGAVIGAWGAAQLREVKPLPPQSTEAIRDTVECLTKPLSQAGQK